MRCPSVPKASSSQKGRRVRLMVRSPVDLRPHNLKLPFCLIIWCSSHERGRNLRSCTASRLLSHKGFQVGTTDAAETAVVSSCGGLDGYPDIAASVAWVRPLGTNLFVETVGSPRCYRTRVVEQRVSNDHVIASGRASD